MSDSGAQMTAREQALEAVARADEETRTNLLDADARVAAAQAELEQARAGRASAVSTAMEEGWTLVRVADVLGVTHQRVSQLKRGE
jgi:DNA-directed RNA polymerase specialized sigma subunit